MATLFNLVGEFQQLYDLATDDTFDEDSFNGMLDVLTADLKKKSAGYVAVIQQLQMEQDKADELETKFATMKKARKNAIKKMKEMGEGGQVSSSVSSS